MCRKLFQQYCLKKSSNRLKYSVAQILKYKKLLFIKSSPFYKAVTYACWIVSCLVSSRAVNTRQTCSRVFPNGGINTAAVVSSVGFYKSKDKQLVLCDKKFHANRRRVFQYVDKFLEAWRHHSDHSLLDFLVDFAFALLQQPLAIRVGLISTGKNVNQLE